MLLALAGDAVGLGLAAVADKILVLFLPPSTSPLEISTMPDLRVFGFTVGVSLLTGIIVRAYPFLAGNEVRRGFDYEERGGGGGGRFFGKSPTHSGDGADCAFADAVDCGGVVI